MIFYNSKKLCNLLEQEELEKLFREGNINGEQLGLALESRKPVYKRTNVFIRIGFFILCLIVAACALGLFAMATSWGHNFEILLLISSVGALAVLYHYVIEKDHFQSGVDDALLYFGLLSFFSGLFMLLDLSNDGDEELKMSIIAFPFLLISAIVFIDKLLSALSFACLIAINFLLFSNFGALGKMLMPFLLMAISLRISK